MLTKAAFPFAEVPSSCTVALLDVEDGRFRDVNQVRNEGGDASYDSHQDPALSAVKPGVQPSTKVSPLPEVSDTEGIRDTVVNPVRGRELIIPHSFVHKDGGLGVFQTFFVQRPSSLRA